MTSAATFTVTNGNDAGTGSLREAMTQANGTEGEDTIVFSLPAGVTTITTASELPDVIDALTIDGSAVPGLTIEGFDPTMDVLVANAPLTLRELGFTDGRLTANGATVTLDAADGFAIAGNLGGTPLPLRKTGAGTVTLSGQSVFPFGADVEVEGGTLRVDGTVFATAVRVAPGAILAGTQGPDAGLVISSVDVEGRVAPSTTAGTLRIGLGPIVFQPGSVLEIDVGTGDTGDLLRVESGGSPTADASLTAMPGASLALQADVAAIQAGGPTTVTVIEAEDGISGSFAITDFAFLTETVTGGDGTNALTITLEGNGETFSTLATTPNQLSVAGTLDTVMPAPGSDLETALDGLRASTADEIPDVLDAVGGEPLSAFATARQILGERTARALHRRVRDAAWGEFEPAWAARGEVPLPALAAGPALQPLGFRAHAPAVAARRRDPLAPEPPPPGPVRAGAWVDAYAVYGELEGGLGQADLDTTLYGATLGVDAWLAERFLVGLAAGYARGDVDPDNRDADLGADVIQGALYAGWAHPRGFVSAYGRYAYAFQDSSRDIVSSGISRSADASFEAQDYGAGAEAGVTLFRAGPVAFQPLAGIDWLRLTEESYRESGAGDLSLDVQPEDLDSTTARFGGRLIARFAMQDTGELVPELRAFWQTELGDRGRVLRASLLGADTGGAIGVEGAELPRSALLLGLGWSAQVSPALQVLADYDALLDADRVEHQATLAVRVRF